MRTEYQTTHSSAYELRGSNINTLTEPQPKPNYKVHPYQHIHSLRSPAAPTADRTLTSPPMNTTRAIPFTDTLKPTQNFEESAERHKITTEFHDMAEHRSTPTTPGYTTSLKLYPRNPNLQYVNDPNRIARAGPNRAGAAATPPLSTSSLTGHHTPTKETRTQHTPRLQDTKILLP